MSRFSILDENEFEERKVAPKESKAKDTKAEVKKEVAAAPAKKENSKPAAKAGKGKPANPEKKHGKFATDNFSRKQEAKNPTVKPDNMKAHKSRHPSSGARKPESTDALVHNAEADPTNVEVEAIDGIAPTETPAEPVVPAGPPQFTLEEFQKQREEARAASALLAKKTVRAVTEDFGGMKAKVEDKPSGFFVSGIKSSKKEKDGQRGTSKNVMVDVAFRVEESQPVVAERAPRSTGKPESPRGGARAPAKGGKNIDVNDRNAFPTL